MTRASTPALSQTLTFSHGSRLTNSSRLIRFLTDLAVSDAEHSQPDFAARLGQLIDFSDALILSAAQERVSAIPSKAPCVSKEEVSRKAVEEEFLQVRSALVNSIARSCTPNAGSTSIRLPTIKADAPVDPVAAYALFHQFYIAHQREIHINARNLQAKVRSAISDVSPQLKQLAVLDAAFDEILWDRTRKLFLTIPKLLEKRFEQLFKAHQQALADTRQDDAPALWMQPGGWLERFCRELQGLLLAELDVRLQPALGLVEAFSKEVNRNQ